MPSFHPFGSGRVLFNQSQTPNHTEERQWIARTLNKYLGVESLDGSKVSEVFPISGDELIANDDRNLFADPTCVSTYSIWQIDFDGDGESGALTQCFPTAQVPHQHGEWVLRSGAWPGDQGEVIASNGNPEAKIHREAIFDIDGDGSQEAVLSAGADGALRLVSNSNIPQAFLNHDFGDESTYSVLIDLNDDGLQDIIEFGHDRIAGSPPVTRINTGRGFLKRHSLSVRGGTGAWYNNAATIGPENVRIADFNRDGRDDILLMTYNLNDESKPVESNVILLNVEYGPSSSRVGFLAYELTPEAAQNMFIYRVLDGAYGYGHTTSHVQVMDYDGDGQLELSTAYAEVDGEDDGWIGHIRFDAEVPDVIRQISDGGSAPIIDYSGYVEPRPEKLVDEFPDEICPERMRCTRYGIAVVDTVIEENGLVSEYLYSSARFGGRDFYGFKYVHKLTIRDWWDGDLTTSTARAVLETTRYPLGANRRHTGSRRTSYFPLGVGRADMIDIAYGDLAGFYADNGSWDAHERTDIVLEAVSDSASTDTYYIVERHRQHRRWDLTSPSSPVVTTNSTVVQEWDQYGVLIGREESIDGIDETTRTTIVSQHDLANWRLGQAQSIEVQSDAGGVEQKYFVHYLYNSAGDLIEQRTQQDQAEAARIIAIERNIVGLPTKIDYQPEGDEATSYEIVYDDQSRFPVLVTNSLRHEAHFAYDPHIGALIATVDANGVQTRYSVDGFGRPVGKRVQGRLEWSISRKASGTTYRDQQLLIKRIATPDETIEFDRYGRMRRREYYVDARRNTAVEEWVYDSVGALTKHFPPYWKNVEDRPVLDYEYDSIGRLLSVVRSGENLAEYSYSGVRTTRSQPGEDPTTYVADLAGRVSSVVASGGCVGCQSTVTSYQYGTFGRLHRILESDGAVTSFDYDVFGNIIRSVDPNAGETVNQYDVLGRLESTIDASGVSTAYEYDQLGRVAQITTDGEPVKTFVYDTGANGVGRLAQTSFGDVVTSWSYNDLGSVVEYTQAVGGQAHRIGIDYDERGRIEYLRYPEVQGTLPLVVRYAYDAGGYLSSVNEEGTNRLLWGALDRGPDGEVLKARTGQVTRTIARDSGSGRLLGYELAAHDAFGASRVIRDWEFEYDASHRLAHKSEAVNGLEEAFDFDGRGRLVGWMLNSSPRNFTYDAVGNMTELDGQIFQYDVAVAGHNAPISFGSNSYQYDELGRRNRSERADGSGYVVEYTSIDLPRTVRDLAGELVAASEYDAQGSRVRRTLLSSTETLVAGLYERVVEVDGAKSAYNVVVDGAVVHRIVVDETTGTRTELTPARDERGSIIAYVDGQGELLEERTYDPLGRVVDEVGQPLVFSAMPEPTPPGFMGHRYDTSGLMDFGGRIYDSVSARFMTPDPVFANAAEPDGLNAYAYVMNQPVDYADPSGWSPEGGTRFDWEDGIYPGSSAVGAGAGAGGWGPPEGNFAPRGSSFSIAGGQVAGRSTSVQSQNGVEIPVANAAGRRGNFIPFEQAVGLPAVQVRAFDTPTFDFLRVPVIDSVPLFFVGSGVYTRSDAIDMLAHIVDLPNRIHASGEYLARAYVGGSRGAPWSEVAWDVARGSAGLLMGGLDMSFFAGLARSAVVSRVVYSSRSLIERIGSSFGPNSVGAAQRVLGRVVQTGGNRISTSAANALNSATGSSLRHREWGRGVEALKHDLGLPPDYHGRITEYGFYLDKAGNVLGNIMEYLL